MIMTWINAYENYSFHAKQHELIGNESRRIHRNTRSKIEMINMLKLTEPVSRSIKLMRELMLTIKSY